MKKAYNPVNAPNRHVGQMVWTEIANGCGWLKAVTGPWSIEDRLKYTSDTSPVWDSDINAWREQSTLGTYIDYGQNGEKRSGAQVLAGCYRSGQWRNFETIEQAKAWIVEEVRRVRRDLASAPIAA